MPPRGRRKHRGVPSFGDACTRDLLLFKDRGGPIDTRAQLSHVRCIQGVRKAVFPISLLPKSI